MKTRTVLIDMDDCSADFCRSKAFRGLGVVNDHNCAAMYEKGFFLKLKPVDGALKAIRQIINMGYDVQIATQPVANSATSYEEKVLWLGMWIPELVFKVNMVHDKGILKADYLIDDRPEKWKAKFEKNGGKFVHFHYAPPWLSALNPDEKRTNRKEWERIVHFFAEEKRRLEAEDGK